LVCGKWRPGVGALGRYDWRGTGALTSHLCFGAAIAAHYSLVALIS
jgi:hypothetical protein